MKIYKKITRKQAGVIYRALKEGRIEMSDKEVSIMYDIVDFEGYDDGGSLNSINDRLTVAVDKIFEGDFTSSVGANAQIARAFNRF